MATNFPTSLDSFSTRSNGQTIDPAHVNNLQDAVAALQAKAGANSSAVATSLDYKVERANAGNLYFPQAATLTTVPRWAATSNSGSLTSQAGHLSGFVAGRSMTVGNIKVFVKVNSGALTGGYLALYSCASNGDLTKIAESANTTATFTTGTGWKTVAMTAPVAITVGAAYVVMCLLNGTVGSFVLPASGILDATDIGQGILQPFQLARGPGSTTTPQTTILRSGMTAVSGGVGYYELTA